VTSFFPIPLEFSFPSRRRPPPSPLPVGNSEKARGPSVGQTTLPQPQIISFGTGFRTCYPPQCPKSLDHRFSVLCKPPPSCDAQSAADFLKSLSLSSRCSLCRPKHSSLRFPLIHVSFMSFVLFPVIKLPLPCSPPDCKRRSIARRSF